MINGRILITIQLSVIALTALILTYFTYPPNGYITLDNLGWVAGPLGVIELPSSLIGIIVSGNIHQPDPMATFIVLFVTYLILLSVVYWFVNTLRKKKQDR